MTRLYKGLGTWLKEKRLATEITQMEAALAIGHSSPQYISNFEREMCDPSLEAAVVLCRLYRVPKKDLSAIILEIANKNLKRHVEVEL